MNAKKLLALLLALVCLSGVAQAQEKPKVQIPNPGVPEIMTMEGKFVRAAYNNEAYVIIGYQLAQRSIGEEWMLLEVGTTVMERTKDYTLVRGAVSITTPEGATVPMATLDEHRAGNTQALQARERVQRDSINYFPPAANRACAMTFFPDLDRRVMPREDVELSSSRACMGRFYFKVPGGIKLGQYWLNVKFEQSVLRVPFKILTEEEEKFLSKNYKDISKQVKEAFAPKKK